MAAIRIEGISKRFGSVQALDSLTLAVEPGAVFGFLGPNGAGKTTTIRILTGLARPDAGRAWVAGVEVGDGKGLARRIGCLPEEPACYPWMTPREFLDYIGRVFDLSAAERAARTRELLELVGLTEVERRRIGTFSRGMRQRMGLAQALVNRPEVLFLDEPASALDPAGRREVLELIGRLRGQCTVFMSTHILADVERVCDSVGIINRGRLVTEARQEELLARYAVPAFEVEVENGAAAELAAWVETLRRQPWVAAVAVDGSRARVMVNDVVHARQELLSAAAQSALPVVRYEVVRPSLEEVFLRLVGEEGER